MSQGKLFIPNIIEKLTLKPETVTIEHRQDEQLVDENNYLLL